MALLLIHFYSSNCKNIRPLQPFPKLPKHLLILIGWQSLAFLTCLFSLDRRPTIYTILSQVSQEGPYSPSISPWGTINADGTTLMSRMSQTWMPTLMCMISRMMFSGLILSIRTGKNILRGIYLNFRIIRKCSRIWLSRVER
jgi:hypothetical protein